MDVPIPVREGEMEEVKINKIGDTLMITGTEKAAVEAAAAEMVRNGPASYRRSSRWAASG